MGEGPRHSVPLKRRRQGKTDYKNRLGLLKSGKPRAVVRVSNKHVRVQFIGYCPEGDEILASASTVELEEFGWDKSCKNLPSAYLVGFLAGKKAKKEGIEEAVLDIGLNKPHPGGRYFTALKGMLDAGIYIPHSEEILPDDGRSRGEHIGEEVVERFEDVKSKLEEY